MNEFKPIVELWPVILGLTSFSFLLENWKIPKVSLMCKYNGFNVCSVRTGFSRHAMLKHRLLTLVIILHLVSLQFPSYYDVWYLKYFIVFLLIGLQVYTALYWHNWGVKYGDVTKRIR